MTMYLGTNRLGRPLTDDERKDLAATLRAHDFVGASMVALRFAYRLRRNRTAAKDLLGRANLRLVRQGWDPNRVTLVKALCRFVWSEHTNEKRESKRARRAEEVFLREQEIAEADFAPSQEDLAVRLETEREEEARGKARLEALRASFEEARDEVNLLWLDYSLRDIEDLHEMARLSRRDVKDFYAAARRRKRHTMRLLAAESGVPSEDDEGEEDA
jgi:hypothetical protein